MKAFITVGFVIFLVFLGIMFFEKIKERDEKKGGVCSFYLIFLGILFMIFLNVLGFWKSCTSHSERGSRYDYYEDRARRN